MTVTVSSLRARNLRLRLSAAVLTVTILGGCASSEFHPEGNGPVLPAYQGEVALLGAFPKPGTYRNLGIVMVKVYGISYPGSLERKMRKVAAGRGADAVVLQGKRQTRRDAEGHETEILAGWAIRRQGPPR